MFRLQNGIGAVSEEYVLLRSSTSQCNVTSRQFNDYLAISGFTLETSGLAFRQFPLSVAVARSKAAFNSITGCEGTELVDDYIEGPLAEIS